MAEERRYLDAGEGRDDCLLALQARRCDGAIEWERACVRVVNGAMGAVVGYWREKTCSCLQRGEGRLKFLCARQWDGAMLLEVSLLAVLGWWAEEGGRG